MSAQNYNAQPQAECVNAQRTIRVAADAVNLRLSFGFRGSKRLQYSGNLFAEALRSPWRTAHDCLQVLTAALRQCQQHGPREHHV